MEKFFSQQTLHLDDYRFGYGQGMMMVSHYKNLYLLLQPECIWQLL